MENTTKEDLFKEAEDIKKQGNVFFTEGHFEHACERYDRAIEILNPRDTRAAAYFCNRSLTQIRLENYGSALSDAEAAIAADSTFAKGYYRKSSALFALGKLDDSIAELVRIQKELQLASNPEVNERLKTLRLMKKQKEFFASIQYEDELDQCDENKLVVESGYDGPVIDHKTEVDLPFAEKLLEFLKQQKKLHKKYLWILLKRVRDILDKEKNVVSVPFEGSVMQSITVCGDIHGQYYDVMNIFKLNGYPSREKPYLFNGDFVDRGSFSVECTIALFIFKLMDPSCIYLNRGNHENPDMNKMYGFEGEVNAKYCSTTFALYKSVFYSLPLAHVIGSKVLVLHGGLFEKDGVKLEDLQKIQRKIAVPHSGLMCDMLWADPTFMPGRHKSKRGVSHEFGPDVAAKFLDENKLGKLTRSACKIASSEGRGLRGRKGRPSHHRFLSP